MDWLKAFWPITWQSEFYQITGLRWNINIFHFRLFPGNYRQNFSKKYKRRSFFGQSRIFLNILFSSSFLNLIKYHCAELQQKTNMQIRPEVVNGLMLVWRMLTVWIYVYISGAQPGISQGRVDFLDFLKLHSEREI